MGHVTADLKVVCRNVGDEECAVIDCSGIDGDDE